MKPSRTGSLVLLLLVAVVGCGGPGVDKQGAPVSAPEKVIHLAAADPGDPWLAYFIDALGRQPGRRIRVEVDRKTYFSETPGGEAKLAHDLRDGRVDFAYLPSRDWAATGDPGFRAVQSPFQITTTETTVALAESSTAAELLRGMARYDGVVGFGLLPAEPRRLVTKTPILTMADLRGSRVRISDSDQTATLITALGGQPKQGMTAAQSHAALETDALDGVETAAKYVAENAYNVRAPYLTSFAVVPKFEILAAGRQVWAKLSVPDQQALRQAAAQTLTYSSEQVMRQESSELAQLCANGLVVVRPTLAALSAMARSASVATSSDRPTKDALVRISAAISGTGPQLSASTLPASCPEATNAAQARSQHERIATDGAAAPSSSSSARIPAGTYEYSVTKEQQAAAGLNGPDFSADITYTQILRADGTFRETQNPDYPDQGPITGRYTVAGDVVTFTFDPGPTGSLSPEKVRWSFYQGVLTFSVISVQDPDGRLLYAQPWRKIA